MTTVTRRGLMLVVSSPSGAGKTTITRRLLDEDSRLTLSVSATTRQMRPGEIDGKHYHFKTHEAFQQLIAENGFLEYAEVYGNFYGTPKAPVEAALASGHDVLFDIDWQGAQQVREQATSDVVGLFLLPPSMQELERRLKSRAQDTAAEVSKRMAQVASDVTRYPEYDYVIINEDLEESMASVHAILRAERLKRTRQTGLGQFVTQFL